MAPVGSGAAAARVGLRIVAKKGGWVLRREPGTRRARTFELKGAPDNYRPLPARQPAVHGQGRLAAAMRLYPV